jgi:DNA-binding NtrC family response regulator
MSRILLIDDEALVLSALQRALQQQFRGEDLQLEAYTDPFAALKRICEQDFDVVISDFMMPQLSGGELLQALKDVAPHTVRIMLSASTSFDTALSAINQAQVFRFIAKPWQPAELEQTLRAALQLRASQRAAAAPPSPQEVEAQRLEAEEPGILHVKRAPDGSIIL